MAACKKLHEMGAFTDMLLPDKGSGEEAEKVDQNDERDPLPGTARHREFYPEGVANILQVSVLHGFDFPSMYYGKLADATFSSFAIYWMPFLTVSFLFFKDIVVHVSIFIFATTMMLVTLNISTAICSAPCFYNLTKFSFVLLVTMTFFSMLIWTSKLKLPFLGRK